MPNNDGLLDFQGIEYVYRLLGPEGVPILKGTVPLAQSEALAIESHDPVCPGQPFHDFLLPVCDAARRSMDEQDGLAFTDIEDVYLSGSCV